MGIEKKSEVMENLKMLIGKRYEDEGDFAIDIECSFTSGDGEVFFGDEQTIPFHSNDERRMEVYNDRLSFVVHFKKDIDVEENVAIEILDIYPVK